MVVPPCGLGARLLVGLGSWYAAMHPMYSKALVVLSSTAMPPPATATAAPAATKGDLAVHTAASTGVAELGPPLAEQRHAGGARSLLFTWLAWVGPLLYTRQPSKKSLAQIVARAGSTRQGQGQGQGAGPAPGPPALVAVALALGRCKPRDTLGVVNDAGLGAPDLLGLVSRQSAVPGVDTQPLATAVLHFFLASAGDAMPAGGGGDGAGASLEMIIGLLAGDDMIAAAAAELLVDAACKNQTHVTDTLIQKLADADADNKPDEDSLPFLRAVGALLEQQERLGLVPQNKTRVTELLLGRIDHANLAVRNESIRVIALMDPSYVVAPLCSKLQSRDDRLRSAAQSALVGVLNLCDDVAFVMTLLMNQARSGSATTVPNHPGDIACTTAANAASAGGVGADVDVGATAGPSKDVVVGRIMDVFLSWSSTSVLGERWASVVVPFIIHQIASKPKDEITIKVASRLSARLGSEACLVPLVADVLRVLQSQPGLTNEAVEKDTTGAVLQVMLFQRLAPLLLLRVLPHACFTALPAQPSTASGEAGEAPAADRAAASADAGAGAEADTLAPPGPMGSLESQLHAALYDRTMHELEFEDVRKVAADLLSRLRPGLVLPAVLARLKVMAEGHDNPAFDAVPAKMGVYVLCSSMLYHQAAWRGLAAEFEQQVVAALARFLRIPLFTSKDDRAVDQLKRLQHGCLDTIGLVIALHCNVGGGAPSRSPPRLIEVIAAAGDGAAGDDAAGGTHKAEATGPLDVVLGHLQQPQQPAPGLGSGPRTASHEDTVQFRVCMANAVIASVQHLSRLEKDSTAGREMLYKHAANSLLAIGFGGTTPTPTRVKAAATQVLATMLFSLKDGDTFDVDLPELAALCTKNLTKPAGGEDGGLLRMCCLKLLAVLIERDKIREATVLPGSTIARLCNCLKGVANMDPSEEARSLAAQCLAHFAGGSPS